MNTHATQVIDVLGGTAEVARLCQVAMPSVSDWKKEGIPRARMMFLQAVRAKKLAGIDLEAAISLGHGSPKELEPNEATEAANG